MNKTGRLHTILAVAGACASAAAPALTFDYTARARAAYEADGPHDLGLTGGGRADNAFLDLSPRVLVQFDRSWTGFARGRVFLPTGRIAPFDNSQPEQPPTRVFAALDEAWLQYQGFTSYPGEALRLGRQLLREDDGEYLGAEADALRWLFDTTLYHASAGVAHQFSAYRTDAVDTPSVQQHRIYGFANVAADWRPEHRIGLRFLQAADTSKVPPPGTLAVDAPKRESAQLSWIGLYANNGYYEPFSRHALNYAVDASYVVGHQYRSDVDPAGRVEPLVSQHIGAYAASAALRWRPFRPAVFVGAAYTYSQGGDAHQYQQAGLQTDASYFTGTPTFIYRYNETLRAELGNLRVATAYVSWTAANNDASLIVEKFWRDDRTVSIFSDALTIKPANPSRDIGNGVDLVLSHYFNLHTPERGLYEGDRRVFVDPRSVLRLRGSLFDPGTAYDHSAKLDYRVLVEATLWLF